MGSEATWVLDAGNSRLKFARAQGGALGEVWQVPTPHSGATCSLERLQQGRKLPKRLVYCSVIPKRLAPCLEAFEAAAVTLHRVERAQLERFGFRSEAEGAGADRLVAGFAAWKAYQRDLLVIDLGTATTFDLVTKQGGFLGGAIFPGVELCKSSLIKHAEGIPPVELAWPKSIIGKTSTEAIQSGILFGYTSLVETMLAKIAASHGAPLLSIATGGLAPLICQQTQRIEAIKPNLTLEGLAIVANQQA